jgi:Putative tail fiber protein gp53-like, C-terminal
MPRDGSGIYTKPFPDVVTGTTIASTVHNGIVADVETDLNAPRPIIAGGTGATSALQARANLQAERAFQTITNFDSAVWECGSFYAPPNSTGAPILNHAYIGIVYGDPAGTLTIEARDITVAPNQNVYTRTRTTGVWGGWSGGTLGQKLSGDLEIEKSYPLLTLDTLATTEQPVIFGDKVNLHRWAVVLGNTTGESGVALGSDFQILRYNNSGGFIDAPFSIVRNDGKAYFFGGLQLTQASPSLILNKTAAGSVAQINGQNNGLNRWLINIANGTADDFAIGRCNDAGAQIDAPFFINRVSGGVSNPAGTDWGSGPMRFKYIGGLLKWDKDLNNVDRVIWELGSCPANGSSSGYQRLGSGIIIQWGSSGVGGDVVINFPTAFPIACFSAVAIAIGGLALPTTSLLSMHQVDLNNTAVRFQGRYTNNGGIVGASTQGFFWMAVGV